MCLSSPFRPLGRGDASARCLVPNARYLITVEAHPFYNPRSGTESLHGVFLDVDQKADTPCVGVLCAASVAVRVGAHVVYLHVDCA